MEQPAGEEVQSSPGTPMFINPDSNCDNVDEMGEPEIGFGFADEPLVEGEGEVVATPPLQPPQDHSASSSSSPPNVQESRIPEEEPEVVLDPPLTVTQMLVCNWEAEYDKCPTFGDPCKLTQVIRQFHEFRLHPGAQRLWDKLYLIY